MARRKIRKKSSRPMAEQVANQIASLLEQQVADLTNSERKASLEALNRELAKAATASRASRLRRSVLLSARSRVAR
jgi:hypothetical protein